MMTYKVDPSGFAGMTDFDGPTLPAYVHANGAVDLSGSVISSGLCVPRGLLTEVSLLRVGGLSEPVTAQAEVLNRWSDGSIRWMLVSFVIPATDSQTVAGKRLRCASLNRRLAGVQLPVTFRPVAPEDDSAASRLFVQCREHTVVKVVRNVIQISAQLFDGADSIQRTLRIAPRLSCPNDTVKDLIVDGVLCEVYGPVRQVFVVSTRAADRPDVTLQFRITNWPTAGLIDFETRIRNTRRAVHKEGLWDLGDCGSFRFNGLEMEVSIDQLESPFSTRWLFESNQSACEAAESDHVTVRQFASGGSKRTGPGPSSDQQRLPPCGYEVRWGAVTWQGHRAEPVVTLASADAFLAVAVPEFWQKFPTSVSAECGRIKVGLFPEVSEEPYELQGGEQSTQSIRIATGSLRVRMSVSAATAAAAVIGPRLLHQVLTPPQLISAPDWYWYADVFPWFPGSDSDSDVDVRNDSFGTQEENQADDCGIPQEHAVGSRLRDYLTDATSGEFSLEMRRARIDEYGWRNFGDVHADHEQTHFAGRETVVSHYNNQYDLIYGGILQFAATGDLRWRELFDPLARHVIDIDIYHTNQDRAAFNGGLFWHTDHYVDAGTATHRTYSRRNLRTGTAYGGGPGAEHNYTTGLMYYHFLTGSAAAREAVLSLAEWVIRMDDGRNTVFALLDDGPTGLASATFDPDFHGPGRGAGNSLNALLDAWLLTNSDRFLRKAEELIRRCVHPNQDIGALHLLDAERHWSYTVFLTSLSRYLLLKREAGATDGMYAYARGVMSHYGRWMAKFERPTLSCPDELQYPTEAWAAQDVRKANVLHLAAACEDDPGQARTMRMKARELSDAAWNDLYEFSNAHLTARCLAILMTEGAREVFHRNCQVTSIPPTDVSYPLTKWNMFVPQRTRVKALFRNPLKLLRACWRLLSPNHSRRAIRALYRLF